MMKSKKFETKLDVWSDQFYYHVVFELYKSFINYYYKNVLKTEKKSSYFLRAAEKC